MLGFSDNGNNEERSGEATVNGSNDDRGARRRRTAATRSLLFLSLSAMTMTKISEPFPRPDQNKRIIFSGSLTTVFKEAYYPQNLTLSATAEKPKPKTPQIAAQKLGLGFYNGKIRSQTAPQREEILVRFYSHCLGCCSSENTRPINLKLHSDVLAVECAKFDHPVGNNQEGSSAAAAQKSTTTAALRHNSVC
ncbi:hypothetical protein Q3G72_005248 [Acer saccharum]|nr:hypothetical protein Q3G72_005248 [Acer saccharum]